MKCSGEISAQEEPGLSFYSELKITTQTLVLAFDPRVPVFGAWYRRENAIDSGFLIKYRKKRTNKGSWRENPFIKPSSRFDAMAIWRPVPILTFHPVQPWVVSTFQQSLWWFSLVLLSRVRHPTHWAYCLLTTYWLWSSLLFEMGKEDNFILSLPPVPSSNPILPHHCHRSIVRWSNLRPPVGVFCPPLNVSSFFEAFHYQP